jgi:hypothetical protein
MRYTTLVLHIPSVDIDAVPSSVKDLDQVRHQGVSVFDFPYFNTHTNTHTHTHVYAYFLAENVSRRVRNQ